MPHAKRKAGQDKAAALADGFEVELADGPSGESNFLDALAVLLLDIAAKRAARAAGKSTE